MAEVSLHSGESQESLLKRFTSVVQRSGVLRDAKRKRYFVSKSQLTREKLRRAIRRAARRRVRA